MNFRLMGIKEIGNEIIEPNFDLGMDYAEIGLDEFFDNGLLKEIPVVKTLSAVVKTGVAIKERFFIKNFLVFLQTFHQGAVDEERIRVFKERFNTDESYRAKVIEQVSVLVDRLNSTNKAKIAGHLFAAHIQGEYDWDRYVALSNILDMLQEITYPVLQVLSQNNFANLNTNPTVTELRNALNPQTGDVDFFSQHREYQGLLMAAGIAYIHGSYFGVTSLGRDLYVHGISKIL